MDGGICFYVLGSSQARGHCQETRTSWEMMGCLNPYKGKLMIRKFSKVSLASFNAKSCLHRELSGSLGGNYMWNETHYEESMKIGYLFLVFHVTEGQEKRNNPYLEKSMGIIIPGSSHLIRLFLEFNHATGNSCENTCTIYGMQYTIGWQFDGTEGRITWKKYGY